MASTYIDTPFSTVFAADSGDTSIIQDALIALQSAVGTSIPTPSGFSLTGVTWAPGGTAGSPNSGTLIYQWSPTP